MPAEMSKEKAAENVARSLDILESLCAVCRSELEESIENDRVDWERVLEDCDEISSTAQRMRRIAQIACREETTE